MNSHVLEVMDGLQLSTAESAVSNTTTQLSFLHMQQNITIIVDVYIRRPLAKGERA